MNAKIKQFFKQTQFRLKSFLKHFWRYVTFANVIIFIGILTGVVYIFSYWFPFTDNAFVVSQVRPVAAQVRGFVTEMNVKNGEYVIKGQKLFTVFQKPYEYDVAQLSADLDAAKSQLEVLQMTRARDEKISKKNEDLYIKHAQDDAKYHQGYAAKSVSLITLQNSEQNTKAAKASWLASLNQVEIDTHSINAQKKVIEAIIAKLNLAKLNLELTNVYAQDNGVVQNLFLTLGAPIKINQPIFSLVYTDETYIQANFNETDLRNVRKGSKVLIFPRMYLGRKMFHGVVDSDYWSANRQLLDSRTQLQNVTNENQWILLPQRLPVIVKVTDTNDKYPLRVGSSAYVYVKSF